MYPLLCPGGYGVPQKSGRFRIVKITATCSDSVAAAQLQLADTAKTVYSAKDKDDKIVVDLKRVAACQPNIIFDGPEGIPIRNGLFPLITTNLVPGSTLVYIR